MPAKRTSKRKATKRSNRTGGSARSGRGASGRTKATRGKARSKRKSSGVSDSGANSGTLRLNRVLASAGYGSRRQCEELIEAGRVEVDGQIVTKLGTTVDPETAKVRVDGDLLKPRKLIYYAVNKPIGVVTTNRDPQGRPRVIDLVPPSERVFPVGRLDRNSEGLILLTNDGELAQKLTHPKFGVRKVYRVTVAGKVDTETMKQMRRGIHLAEGLVRVEGAKLLKSRSRSTEMEIVLREGKNREIRRILARLGHKVQHLRRIAVGPLRLGDLPAGAYRVVRRPEIEKLWQVAEAETSDAPPMGRKGRKKANKKRASNAPRNTSPTGLDSNSPAPSTQKKATSAQKRTSTPRKRATKKRPPEYSAADTLTSNATIGSVIGGDFVEPAEVEAPTRDRKTPKPKRATKGRQSSGGKRASSGRSSSGRSSTGRKRAGRSGAGQSASGSASRGSVKKRKKSAGRGDTRSKQRVRRKRN